MEPSSEPASDRPEVEALRREMERVKALRTWDRRLLDGVLRQSPHGIIICNHRGELVVRNRAAERIWAGSATAADVEGWGKLRAFHPDGSPYQPGDWSMARCLSRRETVESEEIHFQRFDGTHGYLLGSCAPITDEAGELLGAISVFADITRLKVQGDRLALLATGSRLFVEAIHDPTQVLQRLGQLVVPQLAESCSIRLVSEDGRWLVTAVAQHEDPALQPALAEETATPLAADAAPLGKVVASGEPLLLGEADAGSLIAVPMRSRGRTIGVVSLSRARPGHPFDDSDRIILQELGDRAAMHLDKARAFGAERRARDEAARLLAVTTELASATTVEQVAAVIMAHGRGALGAFGALLYLVDSRRRVAETIASEGYEIDRARPYVALPLDIDMPLPECIRTAAPLFIESQEELCARYPALAAERGAASAAVACLPLIAEGHVVGACVFSFAAARTFTPDNRRFMEALAHQCAQALERARLADADRKARDGAAFLAEASRLLSSTLDYQAVLQELTRIAVPRIADWCAIEMAEADGVTEPIAVAHTDPSKVALAWEMRRRYPPRPTDPSGALVVIRTGKPELYPDIPDELLVAGTRDPEHLAIARSLGIRSALCVPLVAGGAPLGALTLIWAESGRRYTESDLEFAMELAHRAALAVQNARLYREAKGAIRLRDEFLSIASHELKTPLTSLGLHVMSLQRAAQTGRIAAIQPDRLLEKLNSIDAHSRRLASLIDELLDVSRIEAGRLRLDLRDFDLTALAREVIERFRDMAALAGTTLTFSAAGEVVGRWDRNRIDQVITNLVSNAIKYGQGKPIEVAIEAGRQGVRLEVRDHGLGIEPADQRRIFERFERTEASRGHAGIGLGLWIAKQIVDAHGGEIAVQSSASLTTFAVTLPRAVPQGETHDRA